MKQTAVQWLVNVVQSCIAPDYIPKEIVEQAKEMEKQQIIDAYKEGVGFAEQYYNETFKKK
jgi:hypothetical protein